MAGPTQQAIEVVVTNTFKWWEYGIAVVGVIIPAVALWINYKMKR